MKVKLSEIETKNITSKTLQSISTLELLQEIKNLESYLLLLRFKKILLNFQFDLEFNNIKYIKKRIAKLKILKKNETKNWNCN